MLQLFQNFSEKALNHKLTGVFISQTIPEFTYNMYVQNCEMKN